MNENSVSNNTENDEFNNIEEIDYKNLINRLKDIKKTILLLKQTITR